MQTSLPQIKLDRGIHVMHLFYRIDRVCWAVGRRRWQRSLERLEQICQANAQACQPRLLTYAVMGAGRSSFMFCGGVGTAELKCTRSETAFLPVLFNSVYSYLSVTELEYAHRRRQSPILEKEKLDPGTPAYEQRLAELTKRRTEYEHYRRIRIARLGSDGFYPMNKRRRTDNWYSRFHAKRPIGGHAGVGRKLRGAFLN
jgi:hypothetical protein